MLKEEETMNNDLIAVSKQIMLNETPDWMALSEKDLRVRENELRKVYNDLTTFYRRAARDTSVFNIFKNDFGTMLDNMEDVLNQMENRLDEIS